LKLTTIAAALCALLTLTAPRVEAGTTHVAVAANFTEPAKEIAALFKQKTGHEAVLIFGASGAFYTQITHSAPFEVFLSADTERPKLAIDNGFAVPDSLFTYAIGKLVLWSRVVDVTDGEAALKAGQFQKLSIANPIAAPYGTAALETMKALNVYDTLKPKIVQGNSIAQAFQFVDTRNAEWASSRCRNSTAPRVGRGGRFRKVCMRRSVRTRCCSKLERTARRRRHSSTSLRVRKRARSSSDSATRWK
jgi:molybdate transport system substrate-binding protein